MTTALVSAGPRTRLQQDIADSAEVFAIDTRDHTLTVLHDDVLYRHLRLRRPDTGIGWFDLITWPGCLTIRGDMGTYTFAREPDMFEFFRTGSRYGINPDYWGEKIQAGQSGGRDHVRAYSADMLRDRIAEHLEDFFADYLDQYDGDDLWPGLAEELTWQFIDSGEIDDDEDYARHRVQQFEYISADGARRFAFDDAWEWNVTTYTWPYLWCCHAIVAGIAQYDQHKAAEAVTRRG